MKSRVGENDLKYLSTPCTITEAVQIARGVAEDVLAEYQSQISHLQLATSIQIEILKELVIESGLITEENFRERYLKKAEEFTKKQQEALKASLERNVSAEQDDAIPSMNQKVNSVEIVKE